MIHVMRRRSATHICRHLHAGDDNLGVFYPRRRIQRTIVARVWQFRAPPRPVIVGTMKMNRRSQGISTALP
jgi:hypothetical protein